MNIVSRIRSFFKNTLYYPGCLTTYGLPEIEQNYEKILEYVGVDFIKIEEMKCCGSPVYNAGFKDAFSNLVEHNIGVLKEYGVYKIIFNCPSCFSFFKNHYSANIEFEYVVQTILSQISLFPKTKKQEKVVFHDPCHLGRYAGIYEEPRKLLESLGYDLVEMSFSKELSMCCGAGAGMRTNYTEVSKKMADIRIKDALSSGADFLVTSCPMCYLQLKEAGDRYNFKVFELSEVVLNAME